MEMLLCSLTLKASCCWLIYTHVNNPLFNSESQAPERPNRWRDDNYLSLEMRSLKGTFIENVLKHIYFH